ncbi:MAG: response regulator [Haloarculaceae archaeon]
MAIDVLLVDEDTEVLDLTEIFLEREGDMNVETESDPEAALDRATDAEFDCVVSDYKMPRLDGAELCKQLRERGEDLPFLLYTGRDPDQIAEDADDAGVTATFQKGAHTDQYQDLAALIREISD